MVLRQISGEQPVKASDLFEKHKIVRRLALLWAVVLITWVVVKVFSDISQINSAVASSLAVVIGLLGSVVGLYQHGRNKEDVNA